MQKISKVIISLIVSCLITVVIPFNVFADDNTFVYGEFYSDSSHTGYIAEDIYGADLIEIRNNYTNQTNPNVEVRTTVIQNGTTHSIYFVALSNPGIGIRDAFITVNNTQHQQYWGSNNKLWTERTYNNVTYYTWSFNTQGTPSSYVTGYIKPDGYSVEQMSYRLTFGDLSNYVEPTNYGDLVVGFHTNFSASGTTNNYTITNNTNLDTIEWENVDSNGNDLQNKGINVEIRAVPILYSANSKSALDLLGFQDAVVDSNNGLILWQGNFNDNHKSFIWNDVIHQLQTSNPAFTITSLLTGSVWTRYGWIYQIRYNDVLNSYTSPWQTIYNSTSIKVSDSEKIVNQYYYHYPSGVDSDDQTIFQDINTVNNTTNNWYVNDVPIDPGSSWLDALIQAIAEILGKILDFFSSILDGLVDLILGLFGDINPADSFFNWFSDLFNGIGDIDLTLPQFNIPTTDLSSFNILVQETMDIFSLNNFGFVLFIPLLLIIIKAVF